MTINFLGQGRDLTSHHESNRANALSHAAIFGIESAIAAGLEIISEVHNENTARYRIKS